MILKALFFTSIALCVKTHAETLISDPSDRAVSFPFNVLVQGEYIPEARIFVTASQAVPGNTYALAAVRYATQQFKGLTPETVILDGTSGKNPLHGAALDKAALLGSHCIVTTQNDPSSLFLVDDQSSQIAVYGAYGIQDAEKRRAKALLSLTTNATNISSPLDIQATKMAFAAVANPSGLFDGDGSGIAVLYFKKLENKEKKSFLAWDIIDAVTGDSQYSHEGIAHFKGNRAFPFGTSTPELFIKSPVAKVAACEDIYFDRDLGILYIAVRAEGASNEQDGVRGLVLASCRNGKLQLHSVAPDEAFGSDGIVGGRGSSTAVSLYKVRTMQTRTFLRYVIVVGGVGTADTLKREVYALPVVDNLTSPAHGALASVISKPVSIYSAGNPARFLTRVFAVPAQKPEELFSSTSLEARVGGSASLPGAITDIVVQGEAVFVSVEKAETGMQPGIFHSQPLFDDEGRISGWTDWQRAGATSEPIRKFTYNPYKGAFSYSPVEAATTKRVIRTAFSDGTDSLGSFITAEFPRAKGGVQGLFDFPVTTQSFSKVPGKRLSVQAYCGYKKVVLVQTGTDRGGMFGPVLTDVSAYKSIDGTLSNLYEEHALSLSGGALSALGPLNSSAVLTDGTYGWFVVGGSGGVAVLANAQGKGWDAHEGLQTGFKGLTSAMYWQTLTDTPHVRKLVAFKNNLFVLTDSLLMRYTITAEGITSKRFDTAVLASTGSFKDGRARSFADVIISGPLALLGTSFGLLRSGTGVSIQTASDELSVVWTEVELPESVGSLFKEGPVNRLYAVTPTNDERDAAYGGTVWVLNGYVGLNQALLYRFVVTLDRGIVTDSSVRLYPDYFFYGKKTFFVDSGLYRNYMVTDGSLIALSRSSFGGEKPLVELLPPLIKSGEITGNRIRGSLLDLSDRDRSIGKLVRSSASGAWMVTGDFGVRVQL